jgi:hypothetical protein
MLLYDVVCLGRGGDCLSYDSSRRRLCTAVSITVMTALDAYGRAHLNHAGDFGISTCSNRGRPRPSVVGTPAEVFY